MGGSFVLRALGEFDERGALVGREDGQNLAEHSRHVLLVGVAVLGSLIDETSDQSLIRLRLGELVPNLLDQRLGAVTQLARALLNLADELLESTALLRGKVELIRRRRYPLGGGPHQLAGDPAPPEPDDEKDVERE